MFLPKSAIEKSTLLLDLFAAEWMLFGRHKNNINLVNTHQRSLTVRGVPVNENLLMLSSGSLHWPKIIQETVLQMDVLSLGSVVPFTEHGYSDSAS